jgi:hypothetical protein
MVMKSHHFLQIGATEIRSLRALVIGGMMLRHMHHQGTAKLLLIGMVIQDNFFPGIIPMSKPKLPQANMLS